MILKQANPENCIPRVGNKFELEIGRKEKEIWPSPPHELLYQIYLSTANGA